MQLDKLIAASFTPETRWQSMSLMRPKERKFAPPRQCLTDDFPHPRKPGP